MIRVDIHKDKHNVEASIYEMGIMIDIARKEKDKCLCLIVGYGSTGGTHKIKTAVLAKLEEMKRKNNVKDFIVGSDCDIFSSAYLNFSLRDRIPQEAKKKHNPGEIYVFL